MTGTVEVSETLVAERHKFEVDDGVAYFNTAAMAPLLRSVREAGEQALARRAQPWNISTEDWFTDVETLRNAMAQLMAVSERCIALVPASSYGLATVARNVAARPGQRVLVLADEFPSNYYTWRRFTQRTGAELVVVAREPGQSWGDAVVANIDERTAVASIPNVHWTDGGLVDLQRVSNALHRVGARFVIDASQSLGAMPLDIEALRPGAVVAVGYKWLLGPYSLSYLYLDPALHEGEPLEENWIAREGSDEFSSIASYRDAYRPGAQRYDVGERSNFTLTPMAIAGLRQIREWSVERIATTLRRRTQAIAAGLRDLGVEVTADDVRGPHLLGARVPRDALHRIAASLRDAHVILSVRGSSLRISPHLHTSDEDVERLLSAMRAAL